MKDLYSKIWPLRAHGRDYTLTQEQFMLWRENPIDFHEENTPDGWDLDEWIRGIEELYYPDTPSILRNPFHSGWSYNVWEGDGIVLLGDDEEQEALRLNDPFRYYQETECGWETAEYILRERTERIYAELFKE